MQQELSHCICKVSKFPIDLCPNLSYPLLPFFTISSTFSKLIIITYIHSLLSIYHLTLIPHFHNNKTLIFFFFFNYRVVDLSQSPTMNHDFPKPVRLILFRFGIDCYIVNMSSAFFYSKEGKIKIFPILNKKSESYKQLLFVPVSSFLLRIWI